VTPTKATVARSGAWSVASVIGSEVLFLIVFIMISRILGPRDMGVVALAGVFAELLGLLALLGIPQAVIQSSKYSELQANTAFWLVQASGILCSLAAFFAAAPIARLFGVAEVGMSSVSWPRCPFLSPWVQFMRRA
jgi:O-antigen/teichoic acid export membrane protein